jgi:pilus assembly protein CpaB
MNRQALVAISVAIVLGLVAVYLANTFLNAAQRRSEASELTRVAVAATALPYGTELTREKVRFVNYPKSSLPAGSYQDIAALLPKGERRIVLLPIGVNEPILADKLSGAGKNASIAALLPDGMRAATVRINDVSGVAGFVQPNDSVDVLITRQINDSQITDVLLQDVKVLAMGGQTENADGKPIASRNATFEVDPLGAQKLALGQEAGSLSLVLRKPGQAQDIPMVETVSLNDLRYGIARGYQQPLSMTAPTPQATVTRAAAPRRPAPPRPRPVVQPRSNNIEVIRGTSGNQYEVGDYEGQF